MKTVRGFGAVNPNLRGEVVQFCPSRVFSFITSKRHYILSANTLTLDEIYQHTLASANFFVYKLSS